LGAAIFLPVRLPFYAKMFEGPQALPLPKHFPSLSSIPRLRFHYSPMNTATNKKKWVKPALRDVPIFFECTCYAGAK
jgi:hypothetical protein